MAASDTSTGNRAEHGTPVAYAPGSEGLPRHVAIIMDGNGRWARRQGLPRVAGHQEGARTVRAIVTECARLKLGALTLYSFSSENWKRPAEEVSFLMDLYVAYLQSELPTMMKNDVRFGQIGRRAGLAPRVLEEVDKVIAATAGNRGLRLNLAINYGSRAEITDAVRAIAAKVRAGQLEAGQIEEETIADHLYTAGLPDPDLLIRTAGEVRLSNYLLWQLSYAEFYVSDVCWPEFTVAHLHEALRAYAGRRRKFGAVVDVD
jgi:undecaprenyl diphosphate synthase